MLFIKFKNKMIYISYIKHIWYLKRFISESRRKSLGRILLDLELDCFISSIDEVIIFFHAFYLVSWPSLPLCFETKDYFPPSRKGVPNQYHFTILCNVCRCSCIIRISSERPIYFLGSAGKTREYATHWLCVAFMRVMNSIIYMAYL